MFVTGCLSVQSLGNFMKHTWKSDLNYIHLLKNWFRFNRNYRACHSVVTFSCAFWGPPKNGVLLYNFFPFRIFLENFFKSIIIAQTPLSSSWLVSAMKPFSKLWGKGKNSETFGLWWQVSTRVDVVVQIFFSSPGVDHRALVYLPPSRGH